MDTGANLNNLSTYELHQILMWICIVIGVSVYSALIYANISHHKTNRTAASAKNYRSDMEIFWSLLSFFFLIILAAPAINKLMDKQASTRLSLITVPAEPMIVSNNFMKKPITHPRADE